jgi:hypothetical protein
MEAGQRVAPNDTIVTAAWAAVLKFIPPSTL